MNIRINPCHFCAEDEPPRSPYFDWRRARGDCQLYDLIHAEHSHETLAQEFGLTANQVRKILCQAAVVENELHLVDKWEAAISELEKRFAAIERRIPRG